jgi:hypothetical protein
MSGYIWPEVSPFPASDRDAWEAVWSVHTEQGSDGCATAASKEANRDIVLCLDVQSLRTLARSLAGCAVTRYAPSTGARVSVYSAEAQDIDPKDGGKWAVICEPHGTICQTGNKRDAIRHIAPVPESFCDECREILESREIK